MGQRDARFGADMRGGRQNCLPDFSGPTSGAGITERRRFVEYPSGEFKSLPDG